MKQLIIGGYWDFLSQAATEYNELCGGYLWVGTTPNKKQLISAPATIERLHVALSVAPGGGTSFTFTLIVNDIATALSVTISDADTTGSDTSHTVTVTAGDNVCLRCIPAGVPGGISAARWSVILDVAESLVLGAASCAGNNENAFISGGDGTATAGGGTSFQQPVPTSGVFKKLYVELDVDPGATPVTKTLFVNGIASALTVTINTGSLSGSDTTHEVAVVAGDIVLMVNTIAGAPVATASSWGMVFASAIVNESLIMGGSRAQPSTVVSHYLGLQNGIPGNAWGGEVGVIQPGQAAILKKFYVRLLIAPGAGKSYTFDVRVNGVNSGIQVVISGADLTGNDTINTFTVADFDDLAVMSTPAGAPAATYAIWGLVSSGMFSLPTVTTDPATGIS